MLGELNDALKKLTAPLNNPVTPAVTGADTPADTLDTPAVTPAVTPAGTPAGTPDTPVTPADTAPVTASVTPAGTAPVTATVTPAVTASVTATVTGAGASAKQKTSALPQLRVRPLGESVGAAAGDHATPPPAGASHRTVEAVAAWLTANPSAHGLSVREIAAKLGCSAMTVQRAKSKLGITSEHTTKNPPPA